MRTRPSPAQRFIGWVESYLGANRREWKWFFLVTLVFPLYVTFLAPFGQPWWLSLLVAAALSSALGYWALSVRHEEWLPRRWVAPVHVIDIGKVGDGTFDLESVPASFREMDAWCADHIRGRWRRRVFRYMFARVEDAIYFKLRWIG